METSYLKDKMLHLALANFTQHVHTIVRLEKTTHGAMRCHLEHHVWTWRLLVNAVFSLTGIFHGSAGGMSSGHTWHWGTPERSYQIPLGKPGLVIPRCETLASRSVTFPLHQRKVQRCTPSTPPLSRYEDLQLKVQRGKKRVHSKGEGALLTPPPPQQQNSA